MFAYRKFPVLLLFALSFTTVKGQTWAPIGATWHYESHAFFQPVKGYFHYESIRDTTVYGRSCRLINPIYSYQCLARSGPPITYQSNDSVYFLTYVDSIPRFQLHYSWNAKPGDTWIMHNEHDFWFYPSIDTVMVRVDSIDLITINGKSLRRQWVSLALLNYDSIFYGPHEHIETIGDLYYFFGTERENGWCDMEWPLGLRCYTDTFLGTYMRIQYDSCTQIYDYNSIEEFDEFKLTVFPIPATDEITVQLEQEIHGTVTIRDLTGRAIFSEEIYGSDRVSIKIPSSTQSGMHLLEVFDGRDYYFRKVLIR